MRDKNVKLAEMSEKNFKIERNERQKQQNWPK